MFRERVKELREDMALSQSMLGRKIGVKQSAVGMWESGRSMPEINTLIALADYFNVSVDYLLGRDEPAPAPSEDVKQEDTRTEREAVMLDRFDALNDSGQDKVIGYAGDLIDTGKYTRE